ncbi:phosphatidylserine/phosphatidylglycerophosphate/cardiolipin synthase family protein [Asticcacaulis sp. AND118]|uniref:phospholipase D-like domain-containing protein n=1 Tax=Asticcacaulis sp. AND118 TaxID=2840468 RepID=UPI001CFFF9BF|nr:phosphatidylserine/phosphatidylglycerophosphate/cardiolipin synthase family protein [Asticcacaulis sp. AND118]UDF04363.1 phosphatidylserine/phosphatidylglycerophosphate/cardiolipin synthase family protein [Asticcacaulis sp. AND118]
MEFHLTAGEAWYKLTRAAAEAQVSIDFEQYIVHDDEMGRAFLDLLARKASEGVRVRCLLDGFGSHDLQRSSAVTALREAGAQVIFFNMLKWWHAVMPWRWFPRTHVKTLHVDGRLSLLGSMGLAEYMRPWRDTQVVLSPAVSRVAQNDFHRVWTERTAGRAGRLEPVVMGLSTYAAQCPMQKTGQIETLLLAAVDAAHTHIRLATPYFFPPKSLRKALQAAQRRGVQITLMLSGKTDVKFADFLTRRLKLYWRKLGFEVLMFQGRTLHAKYAVIDDDWATVGSCNFDVLSLGLNREANVVLRDPAVVAAIAAQFETDRLSCLPLTEVAVEPEALEVA